MAKLITAKCGYCKEKKELTSKNWDLELKNCYQIYKQIKQEIVLQKEKNRFNLKTEEIKNMSINQLVNFSLKNLLKNLKNGYSNTYQNILKNEEIIYWSRIKEKLGA